MRRILFIIPILALVSCADTGKATAHIDGIKEDVMEGDRGIRELIDSLRTIADRQQDAALCNAINGIASDMEITLDTYNVESDLDELKHELAQ